MSILFVERLAVQETSLIWRKRGEEQRGAIILALMGRATICTVGGQNVSCLIDCRSEEERCWDAVLDWRRIPCFHPLEMLNVARMKLKDLEDYGDNSK